MTGKIGFILGITLSISGLAHAYSPVQPDSTGVENKNGKTYVVHRVNAGQTLYAVMRQYKTTLQAIKAANPGMKDNLTTGQVLRVPYTGSPATTAVVSTKPQPIEKNVEVGKTIVIKPIENKPEPKSDSKIVIPADNTPPKVEVAESPKTEEKPAEIPKLEPKPIPVVVNKNGMHRVEAGQSLYGVAVKYGVMMADIRRWNALGSDQIRAGQELIVSEQAYAAEASRRPKPDSAKVAEAKKPALPTRPTEDPTNATLPETRIANSGSRLVEMGTAEVIDALDNGNKYLALHRTAPVGSLVQVKNVSNGQSVWVKVIGKLPEISANNRIIIKLSARAHEKLSPGGKRFSAEISYLAQ
ncbi:MAG: LysM peptidoglycan-binding domain-containing protein [Runella slithyformis]|nr:MAG: LysM peptidoglycan-binding domain-containing protein [Cytophagales bacterium]TAG40425.1 MAG: LysM peptidoglycan-binding domain-containing protein [Cytophagia bacterium]TAG51154.1 MAG: LysM peptidoglycan-binding domain-containing protein [Runella slithyformis]TAG81974.1 MAG: LysM peptidoglycan-binding domain-containing protein [Cytophagales bacterium]TAH08282.1 MAG: LysM peptidoglycan-binding domain-containing protein [Runella slithyformis]